MAQTGGKLLKILTTIRTTIGKTTFQQGFFAYSIQHTAYKTFIIEPNSFHFIQTILPTGTRGSDEELKPTFEPGEKL